MTPHLAVICWVLDPAADPLLLVRHRVFGWSCPGGHVEPDESLVDAARRELYEETGLMAGPAEDEPWHTDRNDACPRAPTTFDVLHHFRFTADSAAALTGEDGQPVRWFPTGALPTPRVSDLDVLLERIRG